MFREWHHKALQVPCTYPEQVPTRGISVFERKIFPCFRALLAVHLGTP